MYVDRNGEVIKSVHIWLPAATHALVKEDGLNLSQFVREQLEVLYGEQSTLESLNRTVRLVEAAHESGNRHRESVEQARADRERLRSAVGQMREERVAEREQRRAEEDANAARTAGIRDAVRAIVGTGMLERYERALPENDPLGDRVDVWDGLVAGVSRRCGIPVDDAEVAADLRRVIARERGPGQA